jgi:hypothetical protein
MPGCEAVAESCEVEAAKTYKIRRWAAVADEAVRWSGGVDGDGAGQAGATLCGALSSPSPCVAWSCGRRARTGDVIPK